MSDPQSTLWKQVESIGTCMLVTHDGSSLRSRPMTGTVKREENAIWFVTDEDTHKDDEIRKNPQACLTFADTKGMTFVSLSGEMQALRDPEKAKELWNEIKEAYFPGGPENPSVVLLKFIPHSGEYWDSPSNPVILAIKFIEAKVKGVPPDLGTNVKVQIDQADAPH